MAEKVVVTGLGVATSLGIEVAENWRKLINGVSGIKPLKLPHSAASPVKMAAQINDSDVEKMKAAFRNGFGEIEEKKTLYALWAARSALKNADLLEFQGDRKRWDLVCAEGIPTVRLSDVGSWIDTQGLIINPARSRQPDSKPHLLLGGNGVSLGTRAILSCEFGLGGNSNTVMSACASGTQAIGLAFRNIRRGNADVVIAGGTDSMVDPIGLMFFVLLTAASVSAGGRKSVCRPFDRKRNGLVVGEGAGFLVLETLRHAEQRGAHIHAEVVGYGSSMDGFRLTAPNPEGAGAARAMKGALMDAGLGIEDVSYINAHGTGTRQNDTAETMAIKNVFGPCANRLCISSSKSMIGHLMAASGGPESVYTVLTVEQNEIHPTINLNHPDPKCDLDYVPNVKRKKSVRVALSNSFGFGGQNASIAIRKYF